MTPAPTVKVTSGSGAPSTSIATDTGTWFVTGLFERGPVGKAVEILSYSQLVSTFGAREASTYMHDAIQTFFEEGGARCEVSRAVGPTPVLATVKAKNGSAEDTLQIDAASYGAWANDIDVVITVESTNFSLDVKEDGVVVEEGGPFATNAEAVAWAANSSYIRLKDLGKGDPAEGTKELASGTDDRGNITETQWATALAQFGKDLGPGQVSRPGATTAEAQKALLVHARDYNRVALLDGTDTATVGTLTAQAATLRAETTARYGGLFAPWAVIPGLTLGTTRTVPYCAVQAGLTARSDGASDNSNLAIAGEERGVARYAESLSQVGWSATERDTLADAGVNVARIIGSAVVTYDDLSLVNGVVDDTYLLLSNNRCIMQIQAESYAVGRRHLFRQIDGQKLETSDFGNDINGEVLLPLYDKNALFGETPEEAYTVDTGDAVNTEKTISEKRLKANLLVEITGSARTIEINVNVEA